MPNDNLSKQEINAVEDQGLSLKEIFHIIKKHLVAIILFIVAGVAAGIGYSYIEAPEYVASASLIAMPDQASNASTATEYNGMSMIAETFVSFVSENVVVNDVVDSLKGSYPDVTAKMVKSGMSVSNKNLIIKVSYYSDQPQKSIDFTNQIIDSVVKIANIEENGSPKYKLLAGNLQGLSDAEKATLNSHKLKNTAIAGAVGLVIAAAYTIIFELLDNSFRTEKEVETELDLPILSVIPFYNIDEESKKGGK